MHWITEYLAVGSADDAAQPHRLMTAILNVAAENPIVPPEGRAYAWVPFREFAEADSIQLDEAVTWLEHHENGNCLMICCRAGMGRSVSVALAYLCLMKGMSYQEALKLVSERRPGATPLPDLEGTIRVVEELRQQRSRG